MTLFDSLAFIVVLGPAVLLALLGMPSLFDLKWSEQFVAGVSKAVIGLGFVALMIIAIIQLVDGSDAAMTYRLGEWAHLETAHFHLRIEYIFDWLSIPFAILSYLLCGLIAAFAANYMHREPGFPRFFLLLAMFLLGIVSAALAGSIETLFFGWELVGLSSALLVAFFHERPAPVRNGLRVWTVYRVADAAFLVAAAALHHLTGEGEFVRLTGLAGWPNAEIDLTATQATFIGGLIVFAAAGKSALIPFSGWLPRAMEGPTPSSAVFYGALSIHLGAYLLLRISPVLDQSPMLSWFVAGLGLATALMAALSGRVQSDIKSALSFASLTQVGLIVFEIGLGLRYLPLLHIIGHACVRTLQLLRAPTLLRDYQVLESAMGGHLSNRGTGKQFWISSGLESRLYRWAIERWYLDMFLDRWIVLPIRSCFLWCDAAERRWTDHLARSPSRESDSLSPSTDNPKEIP
jgi:NAD(P)H-quinone oxidoreductase subunit 5